MVCPPPQSVVAENRRLRPAAGVDLRGVLRQWSRPISLSVADQGLASGAHFVLSLLLARWLAPSDYGAFALSYALFLLAAGLHTSLILEPMAVVGPTRYAADLPAYLRQVLRIHVWLSAAIALLFLAAAAIAASWSSSLAPNLIAVGLATPWMLLFWLFRRACYLSAQPDAAVRGSCAYGIVLAAGLLGLWRSGLVSTASIFLLMAGASTAVSLAFRKYLGMKNEKTSAWAPGPPRSEVVQQHWTYARWSLGTTVLYWLSNSIYMPLVAVLAGLPSVAAYRATENLLLPMSQTLTAVGLLLLPWLSGKASTLGCGHLRTTAPRIAALAAAAAGLYIAGVILCGPQLTRLVYGGDRYAGCLALVPYLGLAVVLRVIGDTGFGIALRAAGRPDVSFWATVASAVVTLTLGLGLVSRFGALGAAAGWMFSSAASCAVSVCLFRGRLR
jgi:O-antigen/teichoic acid export membrane protein